VNDDIDGGKIPIVRIYSSHADINPAGRHLGEAIGERGASRFPLQRQALCLHRLDKQLGASNTQGRLGGPRLGLQPELVEEGADAMARRIGFAQRWRMDDAGDGTAVDYQRHTDRPARIALGKAAGAVDRIDNQDSRARQSFGTIKAFLGEPAGLRKAGPQPFGEEPVNEVVGFGDR